MQYVLFHLALEKQFLSGANTYYSPSALEQEIKTISQQYGSLNNI